MVGRTLTFYSCFSKEMLRPIPAALASCTRFFEAMSAMRESFATLQQLRVGHSSSSMTLSDSSGGDSRFLTPSQWREGTTSSDDSIVDGWRQEAEGRVEENEVGDGINQRRLSWPPALRKGSWLCSFSSLKRFRITLHKLLKDNNLKLILCCNLFLWDIYPKDPMSYCSSHCPWEISCDSLDFLALLIFWDVWLIAVWEIVCIVARMYTCMQVHACLIFI